MQRLATAITRMLVVLLLLLSAITVAAQGDSQIRFVHAVPGVGAVDVYVNGGLAVSGLSLGQASGYISALAGNHSVTVTPSGTTVVLWEQSISTSSGRAHTFIASSPSAPRFDVFDDNLTALPFGTTRLLLVHAVEGAPGVDVRLAAAVQLGDAVQEAGTTIAANMIYGASFGAFDLPAQTYPVSVFAAGSSDAAIIESATLNLAAGTSNIVVVFGAPTAPSAMILSAPTGAGASDGFVRFVHAVQGAPAVDVFVNDSLLVPGLSLDRASEHIALPAGEHIVTLRPEGSADEILSSNFSVNAGGAQTIVALPGETGIEAAVFVDDLSGVTPTTATATFINAMSGSTITNVTLGDTVISDSVAFGSSGLATVFSPTSGSIAYTVTVASGSGTLQSQSQAFYGGTYYNLIAVEGTSFIPPRLIIAGTAIAQTLASAPGAGTQLAVVPQQPSEPSAPSSEVVSPAQPVQPTPPPAAGSEDGPTARIVLDPGANLQLRQYPSAEALSLGLAPSGTVLSVIGREGRPVALVEGQEPPAEAADWVDPAEGLAEDEDLVPGETWLRVSYATPDGGQIIAWVNAQYLDVRDERGRRQRLADLETFGGNVPGEASGTAVTPPPVPTYRVSVEVFNLNPGINLNVRRTADTTSEVLARLSNGTVAEFVGLIEADPDDAEALQNWVFISYQPAEGGTITGWVSTQYVRYEFSGRQVTLDELKERGFYAEVERDRIGQIRGTSSQVTIPTPDPTRNAFVAEVVLNQGANLQFRRSPDASSESLNLIPSGTRLIVSSRTAVGDWIKVTYEGEEGWIASQFVVLSFNGAFVPVEQVPVEETTEPATENAG